MQLCVVLRLLSESSERTSDHDKSGDRDQKIGDRSGAENAVDSHKARQDEQKDDQHQLLGQGDDDAVFGSFDREL